MENVWMTWWEERVTNERYALAGGVVVVLLLMVGAIWWALQPSYHVLFSGLAPKDVPSVANQLAAEGLDYEVDAKGGRILVAKDDVYAARIKVMERGLALSGPVGFELFDEAEFGMTDFTQQINYQRALEGELSRTIMALDEIDHARLHLVLPDAGLFRKPKEQPKASLTVVVKAGATLTPARVQGIQRLVAASVPGLEPRYVTVHDQMGVALTRPAELASGVDVAGERLEAKQLNEVYLTQKAQEVLDRAFGPGAAAVIVDVALDHSKRQSTREETLPVEGGVTGAVVRQRTSTPPRSTFGTTAAPASFGGINTLPALNTEVEYAVGRNVEQIETAPGAIHRLTVGVLIPRGLSDSARKQMSDLVASAVGLDLQRGDALSLQELPTLAAATPGTPDTAAPLDDSTPQQADGELRWHLALIVAVFVAILAILVALRLALTRRGPELQSLSVQERERLLAELQQWLNAGGERSPGAAP